MVGCAVNWWTRNSQDSHNQRIYVKIWSWRPRDQESELFFCNHPTDVSGTGSWVLLTEPRFVMSFGGLNLTTVLMYPLNFTCSFIAIVNPLLCLPVSLLFRLKSSRDPLVLIIHWNDSQNSGQCYAYDCGFIIKDMNWDLTKEEMHRERFGRVSNVNLLCYRMYLLSRHICVPHQPGCSPEPQWTEQSFY